MASKPRVVVIKRGWVPFSDAMTYPWLGKTYIVHKAPAMSKCLLAHELVHARQIERDGSISTGFHTLDRFWVYKGQFWKKAFWKAKETRLEQEAYAEQAKCAADPNYDHEMPERLEWKS